MVASVALMVSAVTAVGALMTREILFVRIVRHGNQGLVVNFFF